MDKEVDPRVDRFTRRSQAKGQEGPLSTLAAGVLDSVAFTAATERALAHGDPRAIVLIELGSDDAVRAAAEARILRAIRPNDILGRLDDGRLVVLTEMDGAARVAIRLGDRLREPFNVGPEQVRLTPQVGVGYAYSDVLTADAMLLEAENSPRY
jgi:GGDEF domain-containing protein